MGACFLWVPNIPILWYSLMFEHVEYCTLTRKEGVINYCVKATMHRHHAYMVGNLDACYVAMSIPSPPKNKETNKNDCLQCQQACFHSPKILPVAHCVKCVCNYCRTYKLNREKCLISKPQYVLQNLGNTS